ncbi:LANO_0C01354g1_1 [Lachancea nothofagi CBS 11611]|uniref:LANO_0C01354g1_1 n=1 Tax=Lachancea nothofagi CBS 11611 TaxID=1266666 RepID=A0A1G4J3X3_9SACH|nr:LANO_0C01354g1_1 [Lachancea nothofagi CBS 11611]
MYAQDRIWKANHISTDHHIRNESDLPNFVSIVAGTSTIYCCPSNAVQPVMDSRSELPGARTLIDRRTNLTHVASKQLSQRDPTIRLVDLGIASLTQETIDLLLPVERLSLQKNQLTGLPESFSKLSELRYLDLHNNKLHEFPAILLQCQRLEILDLSSNFITTLPHEFPQVWCDNLKVLSLKNNNVASIRELYPAVTSLRSLKILEIEGNKIPTEELELVKNEIPLSSLPDTVSPEEYWCVALRKHFAESKISKAAKRRGFINVSEEQHRQEEMYSDIKYNDYFKRLSILPEETTSQRVTHDELLIACRKLLFSFTECQQSIRKITSFCEDKAVAVNSVSLLYSVRSHIDNLVELLEQSENPTSAKNDAMVKLCLTIIAIFKQIFALLRKNFRSFFQGNDICFARIFYMNILCSFNEMYNAWSQITPKDTHTPVKNRLTRTHSLSTSQGYKHITPRARRNTLQRSLTGNPMHQATSPKVQPVSHRSTPASVLTTPPPSQNNISTDLKSTNEGSPRVKTDISQHSPRVARRPADIPAQSGTPIAQSSSATNSTAEELVDADIDTQLYHTLKTVISMVNVVYAQLTSSITKSAIASTKTAELSNITSTIAAKIKDLTDICYQSMELSKVLKDRLILITGSKADSFATAIEKAETWENINAFLKSIISILANTKIIMKDLPILNEVRPNLASLAKITKDVTVILDLSSYRNISQAAQQQQIQELSVTRQQQQQPIQSQPVVPIEETQPPVLVTPLSTPSLVTVHASNPFDQF